MSEQLLLRRLKAIKREITALKTAHRRGLGLIKVYSEEVELEGRDTGIIWYVDIAINFSHEFARFPFLNIEIVGATTNNVLLEGVVYAADGFACTMTLVWGRVSPVATAVIVKSTALIEQVTQTWRLAR